MASTNGSGLARARSHIRGGTARQPQRALAPVNGTGPAWAGHPAAGEEDGEAGDEAPGTPRSELHDLDGLRRAACRMRRRALRELPELLEQFADELLALGGHLCWAPTAADARRYIARVAARHDARQVVRWMAPADEAGSPPGPEGTGPVAGIEVDLDRAVEDQAVDVVSTDLEEWIARLADEVPSHLVTAAPHRDRGRIPDLLADQAWTLRSGRRRPGELVRYARERLRRQLAGAEVGVGTADLAVAETGSLVLVTDQPNARVATALPRVQVVVLGLDRVAAGWDQAELLMALRHQAACSGPRSSTSSTVVLTGPRQAFELDGPRELHVVVLDNGRSRLLERGEL